MKVAIMNFRGVFSSRGQNSISNGLIKARENLMHQVKSNQNKAKLMSIQSSLNGLFYSNTGKNIPFYIKQFQDNMINETSKNLVDRALNIDLSSVANSRYANQDRISAQVAERITDLTIRNLQALSQEIKRLSSTNTKRLQDLMWLQTLITNLVAKSKAILKNGTTAYGSGTNTEFFTTVTKGKNQTNIGIEMSNIMAYLSAFNAAIYNGENANMTALGDFLEDAICQAFNNFRDSSLSNFMTEAEANIRGDNQAKRGGKKYQKGSFKSKVNIEGLSDSEVENLVAQGFKINKKNFTATYSYNPRQEKQGKMDVIVEYKTGQGKDHMQQLRLSIKNWALGNSSSLGETSVDAALVRAVGENITKFYKFSMLDVSRDLKHINGDEKNVNWVAAQSGHDLAKLALASDIIMGLNQGKGKMAGMADILLINTGYSIQLFDIVDLVKNINSNGNAYLRGYQPSAIEQKARLIYESLPIDGYSGRTNLYLGLFTSTLNKEATVEAHLRYDKQLIAKT